MLWIGLYIGFSMGMATAQIVSERLWKFLEFREKLRLGMARAYREITKNRLAEAKELHQAAVLRHVMACEMQAEKTE